MAINGFQAFGRPVFERKENAVEQAKINIQLLKKTVPTFEKKFVVADFCECLDQNSREYAWGSRACSENCQISEK